MDPELLIYRKIKHLFDCDGEDVWYSGTVLAFEEGTGQFTIAYDNEDDVYAFKFGIWRTHNFVIHTLLIHLQFFIILIC